MDARSIERCAILVLCAHWMLDECSSECLSNLHPIVWSVSLTSVETLWSPRHHLCFMCHVLHYGYLDGSRRQLVGFRKATLASKSAKSRLTLFSRYNLLIARFFLGLAVGAKSSTTPVYAAESAPKNIRGA